ncbi:N-acetylgalactosamine-6-O-sulfatase [subsurface metagenome]
MISRRKFLRAAIAVGVTAAISGCALTPAKEAAGVKAMNKLSNTRPNIIVVLADDMSYWDISHFGQKEFATPNIDRLAREGMVFTNAYASSPQCASSRAGLLTGLHMGHSPIRRNTTDVRPKLHSRPYLSDHETIADMLRCAGYTTCQVGKWHVGEPDTPGMPHLQGFEQSFTFDHSKNKREQYAYPTRLWRNGERIDVPENRGFKWNHPHNHYDESGQFVPGGISDPSKAIYCEDIYLKKVLEFIREPREKPFFLYYATTLTHAEWPKELRELKDKKAPWTIDQKRWAGQVTHLDRSLGAIVKELKDQGMDKNTLLIFTSDNGYSAWGYSIPLRGRWEDDPVLRKKGPWDGGKFIPANGGMIVPFIAWGPGLVRTGETSRAVAHYDFKKTFAGLAGASTEKRTDGASFAALLSGEEEKYAKRPFLYWEQGGYERNAQSVLLDERFFALRISPDKPIQIFDIFKDPGCKKNLAADHQDLIGRAQALFLSEHGESPWYVNLTRELQKAGSRKTEE